MSLQFEWDEEKANANIKKHGIPFETAAKVFLDENRIEIYDKEHSIKEDRYITIGMANDVLFVVYTERYPKTRLISARLATAKERPTIKSQAEKQKNKNN
ncbi:MAG: BrnT family toxin, partial [Lachnospiraceae bacterium]|nr:BrnT family toxin [Lachnospiraceae bacterium]